MATHGPVATPVDVDRALTTLAYYGGNVTRAATELGMARSTLQLWKANSHRDRYLEIAEREAPKLEAIAAQQARELILRAADAENELFDVLHDSIDAYRAPPPQRADYDEQDDFAAAYKAWQQRSGTKELSEVAGTLQRITTSKGINGTKLLELTGRPTSIVEHRDPAQTINAIARKLGLTIDSTATEEPKPNTQPLLPASGDANAREVEPGTISPD